MKKNFLPSDTIENNIFITDDLVGRLDISSLEQQLNDVVKEKQGLYSEEKELQQVIANEQIIASFIFHYSDDTEVEVGKLELDNFSFGKDGWCCIASEFDKKIALDIIKKTSKLNLTNVKIIENDLQIANFEGNIDVTFNFVSLSDKCTITLAADTSTTT